MNHINFKYPEEIGIIGVNLPFELFVFGKTSFVDERSEKSVTALRLNREPCPENPLGCCGTVQPERNERINF